MGILAPSCHKEGVTVVQVGRKLLDELCLTRAYLGSQSGPKRRKAHTTLVDAVNNAQSSRRHMSNRFAT